MGNVMSSDVRLLKGEKFGLSPADLLILADYSLVAASMLRTYLKQKPPLKALIGSAQILAKFSFKG